MKTILIKNAILINENKTFGGSLLIEGDYIKKLASNQLMNLE